MLKTKVMPKGMEKAEAVYNPPAAMACLQAQRDDSTSRVSVINLMDLVAKCHKNLNLPGFVCLFAF